MPDFIPRRDEDVVSFTQVFAQAISAHYLDYGVSAEIADEYAMLQSAFAQVFSASASNSSRTPSVLVAKDQARAVLVKMTRSLARTVRGHPGMTGDRLNRLGLQPKQPRRHRVATPSDPPKVFIADVQGRTIWLKLRDSTSPTRRGKPRDVVTAYVYTFVGEQPSAGVSQWAYTTTTSKTNCRVDFPPSLTPGTRVWFTACWLNARAQSPMSTAVNAIIGFGGLKMDAGMAA